VEFSNKELGLVELTQGDLGVLPDLLLVVVSLDGLWHVIGFAQHEPLKGFHILGKVEVDSFSRPLS
jgi:hypothetical protein